MLSKYESEVMRAVYNLCDGTEGCLVSAVEILSILPANKKFSTERIDDTLNALHLDGYFDLITSERKGEKMYVITLTDTGLGFKREIAQKRRDVAFKILLAFIGAFATFIFGLIIKAVFGG